MLMPGHLTTTAFPKRLYLIFLWAEWSQRDPIPIVDPLLKIVCIFVVLWGAHYYFSSTKYNKITYNFQNRPPLLVMAFWQCNDKLNVGFEFVFDECSFALIVDSHRHVIFLTYWQTNSKRRLVLMPKLIIIILYFQMFV